MSAPTPDQPPPTSGNITWHAGAASRGDRARALGVTGVNNMSGMTVWLTGLSGSGKSTIAVALEHALIAQRIPAYRLDGDNVRYGLCKDLGFSAEDRAENIRRVGEVCRLMADAGLIVIAAFISPYQADRDAVRAMHEHDRESPIPFLEVFVDTSLEVCEARDPKGLYKKARAGEIRGMTGIDDPYEKPTRAELVLNTSTISVNECAQALLERIRAQNAKGSA
jgi:adenylylsulfate kinase